MSGTHLRIRGIHPASSLVVQRRDPVQECGPAPYSKRIENKSTTNEGSRNVPTQIHRFRACIGLIVLMAARFACAASEPPAAPTTDPPLLGRGYSPYVYEVQQAVAVPNQEPAQMHGATTQVGFGLIANSEYFE